MVATEQLVSGQLAAAAAPFLWGLMPPTPQEALAAQDEPPKFLDPHRLLLVEVEVRDLGPQTHRAKEVLAEEETQAMTPRLVALEPPTLAAVEAGLAQQTPRGYREAGLAVQEL